MREAKPKPDDAGAFEFMTRREVARELGLRVETVCRMDRAGTGPPYLRIGRSIRYHVPTLLQWVKEQQNRQQ
jgi:Helix-turn-helix domain